MAERVFYVIPNRMGFFRLESHVGDNQIKRDLKKNPIEDLGSSQHLTSNRGSRPSTFKYDDIKFANSHKKPYNLASIDELQIDESGM